MNLDRFLATVESRWGLQPKLEWSKISSTPDKDWTGVKMFGYECLPLTAVVEDLQAAGISCEGPWAFHPLYIQTPSEKVRLTP